MCSSDLDDTQWIDDEEDIQPLFTISEISEDSQILNTLENYKSSLEFQKEQFQEESSIEILSSRQMSLYSIKEFGSSTIEIFPGKTLNKNIEKFQQEKLVKILQIHSSAYAWEYTNI